MKPFLSIVIPAFNEVTNFERGALNGVFDYLKKCPFTHEVIIVDDGSQDNTVEYIKKFILNKKNWQIVIRPHRGKASTVEAGVRIAKGENILFTDFDQATPLSEVEKLTPFLYKNYDIVIGSREIKGARREKEPFYRHLMGKVFNIMVKVIVLGGIQDTQCGFKLFKTNIAQDLFSHLRVYQQKEQNESKNAFTGAFDVELLYLAQKRGYKIAEVPVMWRHYKTNRVNPIKDSLRMFGDILKIRVYGLLGFYDYRQ